MKRTRPPLEGDSKKRVVGDGTERTMKEGVVFCSFFFSRYRTPWPSHTKTVKGGQG